MCLAVMWHFADGAAATAVVVLKIFHQFEQITNFINFEILHRLSVPPSQILCMSCLLYPPPAAAAAADELASGNIHRLVYVIPQYDQLFMTN